MGSRSFLVLCAGSVLALTPTVALASSGDEAATQALARATNTLVLAATPDVPRGLAAVKRYASQLAGQCPGAAVGSPQNYDSKHPAAKPPAARLAGQFPGAAVGSPQNYDSNQLDDELIGAMTVVGYRTAAAP